MGGAATSAAGTAVSAGTATAGRPPAGVPPPDAKRQRPTAGAADAVTATVGATRPRAPTVDAVAVGGFRR